MCCAYESIGVYLNDMNPEEAMNELLKRMREPKSNEEFLASMNS